MRGCGSRGRSLTAASPSRPQLRYGMPRHLVLLAMEREYFTRFQPRMIICTSQREAEDLARIYGIDPSITTVLPDPFDPDQFNIGRRARHRDEARARMGLEEGDFALLFVANELHRKGFAQALGALAKVNDHRATLHLIGRTPPAAYAATIERLGLSSRVRYHGPTSDIGWWYAGGDLLVLPTQYEPFGLVIIEALASGLPVITTRLAGAAAAVQHGSTGLIQEDPYDVSELASLISSALDADLDEWGRSAARSVDGTGEIESCPRSSGFSFRTELGAATRCRRRTETARETSNSGTEPRMSSKLPSARTLPRSR